MTANIFVIPLMGRGEAAPSTKARGPENPRKFAGFMASIPRAVKIKKTGPKGMALKNIRKI
jgi:hypothetical protein